MYWISKLRRLCSSNEQQHRQSLNMCKGVKTGRSPKTVFTPFLTFLLLPLFMLTVKPSRRSSCAVCSTNRNNEADFCFPTSVIYTLAPDKTKSDLFHLSSCAHCQERLNGMRCSTIVVIHLSHASFLTAWDHVSNLLFSSLNYV